jgi:hypothetical protein
LVFLKFRQNQNSFGKNLNDSAYLAVLNTVGARPSNPTMKARHDGRAVYADIRELMAHGSHEARLEFMRRPFFPRHDGRWRYVGNVGRAALWHAPRTGRYYTYIVDTAGYLVAEAIGGSRDEALCRLLRRLPQRDKNATH